MDNKGFTDEHGAANGHDKLNGHGTANGKYMNGGSLGKETLKSSNVMLVVDEEPEDPWKVITLDKNFVPWQELDGPAKFYRVVGYFVKVILVLACLYMFICSLDFLSSAFRLLGGEAAGKVFQQSDIMTNPVAGLMMGVLVTVLVQSSSTSTSIVVSMVGAGILDIDTAIPLVMGANIGTSVTNTIVAIGQISNKNEFRRAFAGATVHDMFNWLTVIVLLPIEIATGFLRYLSGKIVDTLPLETNKGAKKDILKVVTKPFTQRIIQINKKAITNIAKNKEFEDEQDGIIMKVCCDTTKPVDCCKKEVEKFDLQSSLKSETKTNVCNEIRSCVQRDDVKFHQSCLDTPWSYTEPFQRVETTLNCTAFSDNTTEINCCKDQITQLGVTNITASCQATSLGACFSSGSSPPFSPSSCLNNWINVTVNESSKLQFSCSDWTNHVENKTCNDECDYLFRGMYPTLSDEAIGAVLLVISLIILCVCLVCIVKLLHSLLKGSIAALIKKFINADFPGYAAYFTGYLAILLGAGLTIVVQSSSIFTSSITPLVGIGVIELDRMYPLTLGSNIGTTATAILAALANTGDKLSDSLQVAFCHLLFNIIGILIFYPLPFFRPAIPLAKFLGNRTAKYRWFAIAYIIAMFFILPAAVFGLSLAGWYYLLAVCGPIIVLVFIVAIIKVMQNKCPDLLCPALKTWKVLPLWMRSLEPYDRIMKSIFFCSRIKLSAAEENVRDSKPASEMDHTKL